MPAKLTVQDFALCGGKPLFAEPLHVGRPNIPNRARLEARLRDCLDRRWLTNDGPMVKEFETRIAGQLGVKHCVAMANGTTALEIASRALGMTGEVIVPSFTFVATAHALQWQQITPVFCDVDPATHLLDPNRVEELITPRTTGIVGVHLWGNVCPDERLSAIARKHNLSLMYDASHAFGCSHHGVPVGRFGDVEVFSFHATKFVNCLEGGVATTDNDDLARAMRFMRNFGFETYDKVTHIGINGKMNEFEAAMGLTCLEEMSSFIKTNREHFRQWQRGFEPLPGLNLLLPRDEVGSNLQYVVVTVDPDESPLNRDQLLRFLWSENVRVRRYFYPGCHNMEPYRTLYADCSARLLVTEKLCQQVLLFPTGTGISEGEIDSILELLRGAFEHAGELRPRLGESA